MKFVFWMTANAPMTFKCKHCSSWVRMCIYVCIMSVAYVTFIKMHLHLLFIKCIIVCVCIYFSLYLYFNTKKVSLTLEISILWICITHVFVCLSLCVYIKCNDLIKNERNIEENCYNRAVIDMLLYATNINTLTHTHTYLHQ